MTETCVIDAADIAELQRHLEHIYPDAGAHLLDQLLMLMHAHMEQMPPRPRVRWSEQDVLLITYADSILREGELPLRTLRRMLHHYLHGTISAVHILPFFPYSSDDGFSVINFREVKHDLGDWDDIAALGTEFDLMIDLVINHISRQSLWFLDFINNNEPYCDYFIEVDPDTDLSAVVRPRNSSLLVEVPTHRGTRHVWATFSKDQIDLNFHNPRVLMEFVDILLFYVRAGARFIRLDAIAYLWKTIGSPCIHLPQTHEIIKLLNDVLRIAAPAVVLLTETNVPHRENISYFGDGDEAHMVYQFALPPLILHALNRGNAHYLSQWAAALEPPPPGCSFLNFTASHDGIGVRAVEQIIPADEIHDLIDCMRRFGGFASMKSNGDGSDSPYEINISYFDAMMGTRLGADEWQLQRFLCSQAMMLVLRGIPAVYIHSLTATPNDLEAVERTDRTRTINRHRWCYEDLQEKLDNPASVNAQVFSELSRLMRLRRAQPALHPDAIQDIVVLDDALFAVLRHAVDDSQTLLAISNVTPYPQGVPREGLEARLREAAWHDLITDQGVALGQVTLGPYQCLWLDMRADQQSA